MLIALKHSLGCTVQGADGYVGAVNDIYFDGNTWRVRYVVLNTGKSLPGRKVVLAPETFESVDWPRQQLFVRQTRQQIKDSSPVAEHEPVSRR